MKTRLVDFHCHLDLFSKPASAIRDAEAAGVYTLTVTTTPKAWPRNYELTHRTRYVRAALGLHPQLVASRADEITLWETYLPQAHYIGEVGIDASPRYYRSLDLQKQIFERILKQCAKATGKILTVHSLRAAKIVLDMIETHLPPPKGHIVLHWFTGSLAEARRAVDLGCYFSVNADMLRSDKGRMLAASLPAERILTETDAPFTQIGGRPACPADVAIAVEALSNQRRITPEAMAERVRANLIGLLHAAGSAAEQ